MNKKKMSHHYSLRRGQVNDDGPQVPAYSDALLQLNENNPIEQNASAGSGRNYSTRQTSPSEDSLNADHSIDSQTVNTKPVLELKTNCNKTIL